MVIDTSDTLVAWVLYLPEHPVISYPLMLCAFVGLWGWW